MSLLWHLLPATPFWEQRWQQGCIGGLEPAGMRWVCSEEAVGLILHGDVSERPIPELGRGGGEVWSCPAWGGSGYAQSRMSCIFTD